MLRISDSASMCICLKIGPPKFNWVSLSNLSISGFLRSTMDPLILISRLCVVLFTVVETVETPTSPKGRLRKISRLFQAPWSRCSTSRHTKQKTSWPRWLPTTGERLRFWRKVMAWWLDVKKTQGKPKDRNDLQNMFDLFFHFGWVLYNVGFWSRGVGLFFWFWIPDPVWHRQEHCANSNQHHRFLHMKGQFHFTDCWRGIEGSCINLPSTEKIGSSCLVGTKSARRNSRRVS